MPKTVPEILATNFSEQFITYMKNRMVTSYYKYGEVKDAMTGKNGVTRDTWASIQKRIDLYKETGNTEWLVDISNMCMMEFMFPTHPKGHFRATDSAESPGVISN